MMMKLRGCLADKPGFWGHEVDSTQFVYVTTPLVQYALLVFSHSEAGHLVRRSVVDAGKKVSDTVGEAGRYDTAETKCVASMQQKTCRLIPVRCKDDITET
jgi:hypothetical protein